MTAPPAAIGTTRRLLTRGARAKTSSSGERKLPIGRQLLMQAILIFITASVLFPLVWGVSMSLDPRNLARPDGLNLIPPGASFDAFAKVIAKPTNNPVSFLDLALNSLKIAIGSSVIAVALGITAALPAWLVILVVSRDIMIVGAVILSWVVDRPVCAISLSDEEAGRLAGFLSVTADQHPQTV